MPNRFFPFSPIYNIMYMAFFFLLLLLLLKFIIEQKTECEKKREREKETIMKITKIRTMLL